MRSEDDHGACKERGREESGLHGVDAVRKGGHNGSSIERKTMNKYQVKWSKELVGKKVYICSAAHSSQSNLQLSDSRWTSRSPLLCEAVVASVAGKHVVVKPSNFVVVGEKNSAHRVLPRELWYTSPRAAVLARLKEICECVAESIREDRVDRIFCEKILDGDGDCEGPDFKFKESKLDGRRDPDFVIGRHLQNVHSYDEPLKLAQCMERFKQYPCDHDYHDVICWLIKDWNSISYEDGCRIIKGIDPLTLVAVAKKDFRKSVVNIKSHYGEDATACFEKVDGGKYKVKLLSVYQLLKAKGRIKLPIITKEWLRSVSKK